MPNAHRYIINISVMYVVMHECMLLLFNLLYAAIPSNCMPYVLVVDLRLVVEYKYSNMKVIVQ